MVVVDLYELEERARVATESIGGVVLEPEAMLLIISEIRRMKSQLGEQHGRLSDMREELLQLRTELVDMLTLGQAPQHAATPKTKGRLLKMKVVSKNDQNANTKD